MSNIYIFGDTHGQNEIHKIFLVDEYEKDDFIIVCGDFGLLWRDKISKEEQVVIDEIIKLPCTLLFCDGNHENFNRLKKLKSVSKFGGVVGEYIKDKAYHLRRGEIYDIAGRNTFVMGGALSIDKHFRTPNVSWWADEAISDDDLMRGVGKIREFNGDIDLVITHTCPYSFLKFVANFIHIAHKTQDTNPQRLETLLEALLDKKIGERSSFFTRTIGTLQCRAMEWFFGHWHADFDFEVPLINAHCVYDVVHRIDASGKRVATRLNSPQVDFRVGYEC